jgi:hypothetical protein
LQCLQLLPGAGFFLPNFSKRVYAMWLRSFRLHFFSREKQVRSKIESSPKHHSKPVKTPNKPETLPSKSNLIGTACKACNVAHPHLASKKQKTS